ncbi:hypothetical protein BDW66DRAFT_167431 [Aspergillus desertorum]
MPLPLANPVGHDKASAIANIISRSFTTSIVSSVFFRTAESTWPPNNVPYELTMEHSGEMAGAGSHRGRRQRAHPSVCARKLDEVRMRWLRGRRHWYLNLIGRDSERKEKGANCKFGTAGVVRALVQPFLERARKDGVPAWLEAVDEHSRDVYAHFGFRSVEVFRVGVAEFNALGELEDGGKGVAMHAMIYE